jgi:hypothetical protein
MLSMDDNPLKFDSERRFFGGHLKVGCQLPDGIILPQCTPAKDIHDGALKECLGIVYIAVFVLCRIIAQNSVRDDKDNHAHLVSRVDLWHRKR